MNRRLLARRQFLTLTGGAVGIAAWPTTAAAAPRALLLDRDVFPVGFWWPPPPEQTTVSRYREIAEAGFNFVTGGNKVRGMPASQPLLEAAAAVGLSALPLDRRLRPPLQGPDQWPDLVRTVLAEYSQYPAFAGFAVFDEPGPELFAELATVRQQLQAQAPQALAFMNLLAIYAPPARTGGDYRRYVGDFVSTVHPPLLCFDHYMLLADGTTRPDYFANWAIIRKAALEADIPTWVFILAVDHYNYRRPTKAELAWQINVSLAYGCKGIQYFTYWSPDRSGFGQALIASDGTRTPTYYHAQEINQTYLLPVGRELLGLRSESTVHANDAPLPEGATAFSPDQLVAGVHGNALIIGRFRHPGRRHPDYRWLLVANRAFDASAAASVQLGPAAGDVCEFEPGVHFYRPVDAGRGPQRHLRVRLGAGQARLYRIERRDVTWG